MMQHLVGGISSAGRAVPLLDGKPLLITRSEGAWLWDQEGAQHIDTALGFGATVLGHAHPAVVEATVAAIRGGPMPAFAHAGEEQAAAALAARTGDLSRIVFTNTGSEAVHLATRIARRATGRSLVAKMAAGYDGWYDDVTLGQAGSPEALMQANARPQRDRTLLLRYNDFDDVDRLFATQDDIAAVLLEPMLANAGCVMPAPGYLEHVAATARRHGALVIADEVLMGFRLSAGLSSHLAGMRPDLATMGKAIGSGFAVAAVAGRPEVMEAAEQAGVRAGTYSGNPVATASVVATMEVLAGADYPALLARGDRLREGIVAVFAEAGHHVATSGHGTVFTPWFADAAPQDYAAAARLADQDRTVRLHLALRRRGLLTMPFAFGRLYLSFAHDDAIIDQMIGIFAGAAREI